MLFGMPRHVAWKGPPYCLYALFYTIDFRAWMECRLLSLGKLNSDPRFGPPSYQHMQPHAFALAAKFSCDMLQEKPKNGTLFFFAFKSGKSTRFSLEATWEVRPFLSGGKPDTGKPVLRDALPPPPQFYIVSHQLQKRETPSPMSLRVLATFPVGVQGSDSVSPARLCVWRTQEEGSPLFHSMTGPKWMTHTHTVLVGISR